MDTNKKSDKTWQPETDMYNMIVKVVKQEVKKHEKEDAEIMKQMDKKLDAMLSMMKGVPNLMLHNYFHYVIEVLLIIALSLLFANSCTVL